MAHGIEEPVDDPLARALRRAVLEHARSEPRRRYQPLLHLGEPGGQESVVPALLDGDADHTLRVEVLEAMVARAAAVSDVTAPLVWLTRHGSPEPEDLDVAWSAAARSAGAELGMRLPQVVVTRRAWRDPATGVGRTWRRLRG